MGTFRKLLSILVVASMLLGLLPVTTFASASAPEKVIVNGKIYIYANGTPIVVREDGIYDIDGQNKFIDIAVNTIECIFGGTKDNATSVASTKVILESGSVNKIYGGGNNGDVEGLSEVIVNGGFCNTLYGGCNYGTAGSTRVELNNSSENKMSLVMGGALKADVLGDINIILNNPNLVSLAGGNNSGGNIGGDINITINGGSIDKIFGGSAGTASYVNGAVKITFTGNTAFDFFQPMGKSIVSEGVYKIKGGDRVNGGASVYIPRIFTEEQIAGIQTNDNICVFYDDGEQISGTPAVSSDTGNKNVFANGTSVTIKTYEADGKTYIYNIAGTRQLLKFPVDGYTIYGGGPTQDAASTNIVMESGEVAAIYGGGLNGNVTGSSFVAVNGGVVGNVYGGGRNGGVNAAAHIKVGEGASVTGNIYSSSESGSINAAVIWVPEDFEMGKVLSGENTRIFKGSAELADTGIAIPDRVTVRGRYVFANGIPIVVKIDDNDGRTYVYDRAGTEKLLGTEVNGLEIYGGSYKGVVAGTEVAMESGTVSRIYGGGYTGSVSGTAKISVTGGDITEVIYGGSYDGDVGETDIYAKGPHIAKGVTAGSRNGCVLGDTRVVLVDSVAKGLYAGTGGEGRGAGYPASDVLGNASYTLIGGMFESLYGGCKSGVVRGTSTITLEGQVMIKTALEPQSQQGVTGGATVYVPENFIYMDKIKTGDGITVRLTDAAEIEPAPEITVQTAEVMSTEGDSGKLVFRFLRIPEPNGKLKGRPGEAYYITFPNGSNMLVDAGGDTDSSEAVITGFLDGMGVENIDYVVASHYHSDHIGRMAYILDKYTVGTFYALGYDVAFTGTYYKNLKTWMNSNPDKVVNVWSGDKFAIDGVEIEVLYPVNDPAEIAKMSTSISDEDHNNNSIVMKMTYGNNTALLTGDIYVYAEKKLIEMYGADKLKSDLLKVPHHGDTTSSDPEFAAAVSPKIAVIPDFLDTTIVNNRYKGVGADTYVTGVDGIVKVAFDGTNDAEVTAQYYVAAPARIEAAGGADTVYVDSATDTAVSYTYRIYDQYGKLMDNVEAAITLTDDNGNLLNDPAITLDNGTLAVKGKPQTAYVVVNFTCGDLKVSKRTVFKAKDAPVPQEPEPEPVPSPTVTPPPTPSPTATPAPIPEPDITPEPTDNSTFEDVQNHWAGKYINALARKGIINGKGKNKFDPEGKMTRAEFASVIARAFDLPESKKAGFTDVKGDAWYAGNINAVFAAGLIRGKSEGIFAPEAYISREEMAVIVSRAYKFVKGTEIPSRPEVVFTDADEISEWAAEDIAAVSSLGLIKGSNGMFSPTSDMTRAEGATIVYNLLASLGLL